MYHQCCVFSNGHKMNTRKRPFGGATSAFHICKQPFHLCSLHTGIHVFMLILCYQVLFHSQKMNNNKTTIAAEHHSSGRKGDTSKGAATELELGPRFSHTSCKLGHISFMRITLSSSSVMSSSNCYKFASSQTCPAHAIQSLVKLQHAIPITCAPEAGQLTKVRHDTSQC